MELSQIQRLEEGGVEVAIQYNKGHMTYIPERSTTTADQ
jgi:biotin operon repressor